MEETEKCLINGRKISAGAQVCEETRCFECRDGFLQERFIDRIFGVGP